MHSLDFQMSYPALFEIEMYLGLEWTVCR